MRSTPFDQAASLLGAGARTPRRRGFTLMEMLVVVGIIIVMTALALPGISKFLDGQSLAQSGRIVQSAFNEARRAAITQRSRNYLVFFREEDPSRPGAHLYGLRRYRERVGYEGPVHHLINGVKFDVITADTPATPADVQVAGWTRGMRRGEGLKGGFPVFEGMPAEDDELVFGANRLPVNGLSWLVFVRDGTIELIGGAEASLPAVVGGSNLFDPNELIDAPLGRFNQLADEVDLNLRDVGGAEAVERRCFVSIDVNTGRLSFRVLDAGLDSSATTTPP